MPGTPILIAGEMHSPTAGPMAAILEFKLEQRGKFPAPGWDPTAWPKFFAYACAMYVDGKRRTPWFARLSVRLGRREFWFYAWPWPRVEGMRRFGMRRLLTREEALAREVEVAACRTPAS